MADRRGSVTSVVGGGIRKFSVASGALEAAILPSTTRAAFDTDSTLEEHYKPIESYEGYHRYDPNYTWSWEDEKKIIRKVSTNMLTRRCFTSNSFTDRLENLHLDLFDVLCCKF
jgi:hypothetical protein